MIDVVFLLIIFFMATAQFARLTRARVDLPREAGEQRDEQREPTLIVNLTADGAIVVERQTLTPDRLTRMVMAEIAVAGGDADAVELTIRADRSLGAASLNEVARALGAAGLRGVRLATDPAPGGAS